jgi:hypothetical protein
MLWGAAAFCLDITQEVAPSRTEINQKLLRSPETIFFNFYVAQPLRYRFQEIDSASLCSPAGRYDNSTPARFITPIDCSKIQAQESIPRNRFHQAMQPGGPVRQSYSYLVSSPHRLFENSSTGIDRIDSPRLCSLAGGPVRQSYSYLVSSPP